MPKYYITENGPNYKWSGRQLRPWLQVPLDDDTPLELLDADFLFDEENEATLWLKEAARIDPKSFQD